MDGISRIGNYLLVRIIGEGGMGTVYLAEQIRPIRRRLALKLVRPGLGSHEILRRFELERQTLSRMEHRGIARILDAGETRSGRPFFVMELFEGLPITEYCDSNRLGIAARLELFLQVCEAVDHAHRKGVIHRDLKPSNLLVAGNMDGLPELKVIDFGIAKALGEDVSETLAATLATGFGQILGTPQYMSPEQAASDPPDTRTDVYGLGAVLYELLTGGAPLRRERLRDISFEELLRLVRELETERPSVRFDALPPDERTKVAARRADSAESWLRRLRGDLDWIVLRAVEKEPDRRYPSVAALAADLGRYLCDEPVEARPPSRIYRLRKFARRNRTLTASVAAIVGTLVAATVVSVRWALEAGESRRLAESRLAQADAVPDFLVKAFGRIDPTGGSRDLLAVEVIDEAVTGAGMEFSEQPLMRARIFEALARIYLRLGHYEKAEGLLAAAEDACRMVPDEDSGIRSRLSGILSEARRLQRRMGEALDLSEGNWREALEDNGPGSEEEARTRNEWITNLINAGELDRAEVALDEAKATAERFPEAKPVDFPGLYATLRWAQGRHDEARELLEGILGQRTKSYLDSDHDLMWRIRHFSRLLADMGRLEEAEAWGEALVRCSEDVYGINHHLTMEAVAIRSWIAVQRGSADTAYFILRLTGDDVRGRNGQAPGLTRLKEHLSAIRSVTPLSEMIDEWFDRRMTAIASIEDPPRPLDKEPAIWAAISDHQTRIGASNLAILAAQRSFELSRNQFADGDPRLTVRTARLVELLSGADQTEAAESVLKSTWTPSLLDAPTGRFLVDSCERLVERLDEAGAGPRALRLDRERLLPALIPLMGSMKPGRVSRSYHRIFKELGSRGNEERMRLQEMISTATMSALPVSDPFRRMVAIRLCEMLIEKGRLDEAHTRFTALKESIESGGSSVEISARLDLIVLESKIRRAKGDVDGAERLLLAEFDALHEGSSPGTEIGEKARSGHLRRIAVELKNHFATIGNEAARDRWAIWDLLVNVVNEQDERFRTLAENRDFSGIIETLENQGSTPTQTVQRLQESLRLAEWLADELHSRRQVGLAARAAMEALRRYRQLGEGSAPVIRKRFLQVQLGQTALPTIEAKAKQSSEIEEIFSELLGPEHRQTWTMRSHRLVFLHTVGGPSETRPLIEEYFEAFPDEDRDRETLRLWYYNHLARCLLDLGELGEALARLETAKAFAESLADRPGIDEGELRRARIMMSNLFAKLYGEMGDDDSANHWREYTSDLESGE